MWESNQMTQTNEELWDKIYQIVCASQLRALMNGIADQNHADAMTDEIMSLIPQPEQLEVVINKSGSSNYYFVNLAENVFLVIKRFKTKQEALDFCKRFNLKVTNEPEGE